jgi:hypothetical protein
LSTVPRVLASFSVRSAMTRSEIRAYHSRWTVTFDEERLVGAHRDRLTHQVHTLQMSG